MLMLPLVASYCNADTIDVWLGTATPRGGSRGIYHVGLDTESGKLSESRLVAEIEGAGFLVLHPSLPVLYSTGSDNGEASVVAFRVERGDSGVTLDRLNAQPTTASGAAHVSVDHTGRVLLSAHYGSGKIASYPLGEDGSIRPPASVIQHTGASGVVSNRQEAPHPHWAGVSTDNRFVMVPDLGLDRIVMYQLDAENATLSRHGETATPAGGGPRHLAFHPSGRWAYLVNELSIALTALEFDADSGTLTPLQTIPTLSEDQIAGERHNSGSEVRVHPSGKFVYSANRGHDTITAFAIDHATGELSLTQREPIRGSWPRNFNLDPSGRWLLAAGRDSNTLAVFEIDQKSGELQYTLETAATPAPICVTVGPAPRR